MKRIQFGYGLPAAGVAALLLAGCIVEGTGTVDRTPPVAPEVTGVTPTSPSSDPNPRVTGHAEPGSRVSIFVNPACAGAAVAQGTAAEFGGAGIVIHLTGNGTFTFYAQATDAAGNVSACSQAGPPYTHDDTPPTFPGVSGATPVSGTQITLSWPPATDATTPATEIAYDICISELASGCSPFTATVTTPPGATMWNVGGLKPNTSYTFVVRARDGAGNTDVNNAALSARTQGFPGTLALATGGYHSCTLTGTGSAHCWGWNVQGELGSTQDFPVDEATTDPSVLLESVRSTVPVSVAGLTGAIAIRAGAYHTCALTGQGGVNCWGSNGVGQLGNGMSGDFEEIAVTATGVDRATALALGSGHTCAGSADGTVRCWGWNSAGQLGDGTSVNRATAGAVPNLAQVVALAAGTWHTCALHAAGTVSCWGANDAGQLGDGLTASRGTTAPVSGVSNAIAIAAGGRHTCALLLGGGAKCWGGNDRGQLGDSTVIPRGAAADVAGLAGAVTLSAGDAHTCAVLGDGTAHCWGRNDLGQLGDGTQIDRLAPAIVSSLTGAVAIAAGGLASGTGGGQSCALLGDGMARCWGRNDLGQLGDGTLVDRLVPVPTANPK